jgi:rSAM/selenodomain-associated transferase 2
MKAATKEGLAGGAEAPARAQLSIGIVVPVYNEAAILVPALERLRELAREELVVVVDGGSADGSAGIAAKFFPVVRSPGPNRGAQLNAGAARVAADVLVFLHADTALPQGFQAAIREALEDPRVVGGCFQLSFDDAHPVLGFYAWFSRFRGRFFHYGDQGFFVRREVFERMGGYRPLPFLEDVDFLRRLKRVGRFRVARLPVVTSARRFRQRGVVRQEVLNLGLTALFELGVPPERLARFYPHVR